MKYKSNAIESVKTIAEISERSFCVRDGLNSVLLVIATTSFLSACSAVPPELPYTVTKTDLQKAANHEYDGVYKGLAMQAPGAICGAGYVPANWFAMMDVTGDRFHLTTYLNGPERRGNVSPGGVLTRYKIYVGRIVDGRFQGAIDIENGCRATFDLYREATG